MIPHLSYSSLLLFLNNPVAWENKYIKGIREQPTSPAALTGVAFHKYAEMRMRGQSDSVAIEAALIKMKSITDVEWGKTGSIEKCEDDLHKFILAWKSDYAVVGSVVDVERCFTESIKGIKIPLLGYADLVVSRETSLHVIDWKTTRTLEDDLKPVHIVQGFIYKFLCEKTYGKKVSTFEVVQIKPSVSKDGTPSVKVLVLNFDEHPEYEKATKRLIKESLKQMTKKNAVRLCNLRDEYEADSSWNSWVASS